MEKRLLQRKKLKDIGARSDYERDYTSILYSNAFKRLKHKTQVFFLPENDHISSRLDHSLYVAIISKVICRNLNLNSQLADAIAIGHDLGHSPFGHAGERILNSFAQDIGGFSHELQSLRVIDLLEKPRTDGPVVGLNLTVAVRDGIVNHCGESFKNVLRPVAIPGVDEVGKGERTPCTMEGCVVRLVDKVAYMGRDIEDGITAGLITEDDIPEFIVKNIGKANGEIVDFFVKDIIESSDESKIALSEKGSEYLNKLMKFNYERIYLHEKTENFTEHTKRLLTGLFDVLYEFMCENGNDFEAYYKNHHNTIRLLGKFFEKRERIYYEYEDYQTDVKRFKRVVVDYIATTTDRLAYDMIKEFLMPNPFV